LTRIWRNFIRRRRHPHRSATTNAGKPN
jgi:hypothetical protein